MEKTQKKNIVYIHQLEFKKFGKKSWSGSKTDCNYFLSKLPYLQEKNDFFDEEEKGTFSPKLEKQFSDLSLCDLMYAALTFQFDGQWVSYVDWSTILLLMFTPFLSDYVIQFLKQNEFHEKLEKENVIKGAKRMFKSLIILYLDERLLRTFFNFLMVDTSISEPLIVKTLSERKYSAILNFLDDEKLIFPEEKNSKGVL